MIYSPYKVEERKGLAMRREKKVEDIKRIGYSWRNLIYNSRYDGKSYSELVEIMKYMYPTVSVSFINYIFLKGSF